VADALEPRVVAPSLFRIAKDLPGGRDLAELPGRGDLRLAGAEADPVRVMLLGLATIGGLDLGIAGRGRDSEHVVSASCLLRRWIGHLSDGTRPRSLQPMAAGWTTDEDCVTDSPHGRGRIWAEFGEITAEETKTRCRVDREGATVVRGRRPGARTRQWGPGWSLTIVAS